MVGFVNSFFLMSKLKRYLFSDIKTALFGRFRWHAVSVSAKELCDAYNRAGLLRSFSGQ